MSYKRYNEYKDSGIEWIGEIPKEWKITKYKYFARSGMGETILSEQLVEAGVPVYSATQDEKIFGYVKKSNVKLTTGDLVIPARGTIGCVTFVNREMATCTQTTIYSKIHDICNKFLYYCCLGLKDNWFSFDDTAIPQITVKQVQNNSLLLPIKKEQEQIASYLDTQCALIDKAIETQNKIIEKLKEYKKSIITEAVTKGLDKNAKMKDSGIEWIGKIPEGWEIKRTKFAITSFCKGNGITKEDVVEDGNICCIRYGEIYSKYDLLIKEIFTNVNLEDIVNPVHISNGDILFAGTGELIEEIGKNVVYLGEKKCLAGGDIIIMKHEQDPLFLSYLFNSQYCQAQKSYGKVKLKVVHISVSDIGNILVAIPPLREQRQIANYLYKKYEKIDKIISDKLELMGKMQNYKKSLIYECVTGKRRV